MKKTSRIEIRVTNREKSLGKRIARSAGYENVSDWLRSFFKPNTQTKIKTKENKNGE
jgi:hypothetical protein